MSATCGAPGCSEPANQRCSRCKSVHYCTRECQRAAWIDHKDMCAYLASRRGSMDEGDLMEQTGPRSHQTVLAICDTVVKPVTFPCEEMPPPAGGSGWELCPVVNMLGVPLAIKKARNCCCPLCVGPTGTDPVPSNQISTRLAIEPHTGMAPPRWAGSEHNHLGTVVVARTDGRDFTVRDYAILDDYIFNNILDTWGLDPPDRDRMLPTVYSRHTYSLYYADRMSEDDTHGASFR